MIADVIAEHGYLFLGSRLKRLAERMQTDVTQATRYAGLAVQPGQIPVLAILAERGPQTIGELARALGLSQPVTTRNVGKLVSQGQVQAGRSDADGRSRIISLTAAGRRAVEDSRRDVWPRVEAAVRQVVEGLSGPLLDQIAEIERALTERPLAARVAQMTARELAPATDADVPGVVALMNKAYRGVGTDAGWATEAAYLEGDRTTEALLRRDLATSPNASLLVWRDRISKAIQGCVWLESLGKHVWYLGSLAVDPQGPTFLRGAMDARTRRQAPSDAGGERQGGVDRVV
jgi:DNA-binding MarR family transcriptional regulator